MSFDSASDLFVSRGAQPQQQSNNEEERTLWTNPSSSSSAISTKKTPVSILRAGSSNNKAKRRREKVIPSATNVLETVDDTARTSTSKNAIKAAAAASVVATAAAAEVGGGASDPGSAAKPERQSAQMVSSSPIRSAVELASTPSVLPLDNSQQLQPAAPAPRSVTFGPTIVVMISPRNTGTQSTISQSPVASPFAESVTTTTTEQQQQQQQQQQLQEQDGVHQQLSEADQNIEYGNAGDDCSSRRAIAVGWHSHSPVSGIANNNAVADPLAYPDTCDEAFATPELCPAHHTTDAGANTVVAMAPPATTASSSVLLVESSPPEDLESPPNHHHRHCHGNLHQGGMTSAVGDHHHRASSPMCTPVIRVPEFPWMQEQPSLSSPSSGELLGTSSDADVVVSASANLTADATTTAPSTILAEEATTTTATAVVVAPTATGTTPPGCQRLLMNSATLFSAKGSEQHLNDTRDSFSSSFSAIAGGLFSDGDAFIEATNTPPQLPQQRRSDETDNKAKSTCNASSEEAGWRVSPSRRLLREQQEEGEGEGEENSPSSTTMNKNSCKEKKKKEKKNSASSIAASAKRERVPSSDGERKTSGGVEEQKAETTATTSKKRKKDQQGKLKQQHDATLLSVADVDFVGERNIDKAKLREKQDRQDDEAGIKSPTTTATTTTMTANFPCDLCGSTTQTHDNQIETFYNDTTPNSDKKKQSGNGGTTTNSSSSSSSSPVAYHVHLCCALWSTEVHYDPMRAALQHVSDAVKRGKRIKCTLCRELGATLGCSVATCQRSYHYGCIRKLEASGEGRMYPQSYTIRCLKHCGSASSSSSSRNATSEPSNAAGEALID